MISQMTNVIFKHNLVVWYLPLLPSFVFHFYPFSVGSSDHNLRFKL